MFGNISLWQLLIVLALVVLLFGTKKLRTLGSDLGSAIKGFKKAVSEEGKSEDADFDAKVEYKNANVVEPAKTSEKKEQK